MSQVVPVSICMLHKVVGRSLHHGQRRVATQLRRTQPASACSSFSTVVKPTQFSPLHDNCARRAKAFMTSLPIRAQSACFHSSNSYNVHKHDRVEQVESTLGPGDHHRLNAVAEKLKRSIPHKVLDLLDENGEALGPMSKDDAIQMSESRGLNLVMVNPNTRPYRTYRLMSKEEFEEEQNRIKERLKKDVKTQVKEVRLACGIAEHDLAVKRRHVKQWFEDPKHEYHVKVTVKGGTSWKPVTHEEQLELVHSLISDMEDHITFNNKPKSVGKKDNPSLTVTLRKMSNKEKAAYNKQKNIEEHEHFEE